MRRFQLLALGFTLSWLTVTSGQSQRAPQPDPPTDDKQRQRSIFNGP